MRALVVGAGLAGVTVAWELSRSGHDVTVLDRCTEAAAETSYANAGLVAPGHAMPWASPGVPGLLLKSLFSRNQAYRLRPRLDWHMLRWGLAFMRECTPTRSAANTVHEYRLCRYAQECLHDVTESAGLEYHARRGGLVYAFESEASLHRGFESMRVVRDMGQQARILTPEELTELEPAFGQSTGIIAGAVYCPTDESGDARQFTRGLAGACVGQGVEFEFGCGVERISVHGDRVTGLETSSGARDADIYVVASGVETPRLTRPIGMNLPIYPVKGYSVTFPIESRHRPPAVGGVLEDRLIAFSRLGDRLRVTSIAEIAGYDTSCQRSDFTPFVEAFSALMPDAADYSRPEYWACLRPMTPNGRPFVGPTRYGNLYLNAGHGNMGWTMACGSARLVADIINGNDTGIPIDAMIFH